MSSLHHFPPVYGRKAAGPAAAPYRMETLAYVGNGSNERVVNFANANLDPDFLVVKAASINNRTAYYRSHFESTGTPWHTGTQSEEFTGSTIRSNRIRDMGLGYFRVNNQLETNADGVTYIAYAFQDTGDANSRIRGGWYTGDDSASRTIPTAGITPDIVWLLPRESNNELATVNGSNVSPRFNRASESDVVVVPDGQGFGVTLAHNSSTRDYLWVAFESTTGYVGRSQHTGTGSANEVVNVDPGVTPDLVIHLEHDASNTDTTGYFRVSENVDGECLPFRNTDVSLDGILRFNAGSYEVGANAAVNLSGRTYYGQWFKEAT